MHCKLLPLVGIVAVLFVAFGWGPVGRAQADFSVNLSGHETSRGHQQDDVIVGVRFVGWVGGTGAEPDPDDDGPVGWVPPPGEGGHWSFVLDFCCASTTDPFVTILGGSWDLRFPGGSRFSGSVESGIVQFPLSLEEDLGCGPGITTVSAILLFDSGGNGGAEACLDDVREPQPPFRLPIWGTIHQP
jgi:hypothetical protein